MIQSKLNSWGLGIAELVGIITSFLFITGISYFYAYYAAGLNAAWIINLLTTKELLVSNLRLGVSIIMAFMYLESLFQNDNWMEHIQSLIIGCFMFLAMLIYCYVNNQMWLEILSYLLTLIAVFLIVKYKLSIKLGGILLIFFAAPFLNGLTAYDKKIESNLPEVSLKDDSKKWYLFDTFSDQAILIDSKNREKNIKILPINDLENIRVK